MMNKDNYVWYVSYGSNMLKERFLHYIKGGSYKGGRSESAPCTDTSEPLKVRTCNIPYDLYFANRSGSWGGKGVAFLDPCKPRNAKGVAYLITREQFEHVSRQENGGAEPCFASE